MKILVLAIVTVLIATACVYDIQRGSSGLPRATDDTSVTHEALDSSIVPHQSEVGTDAVESAAANPSSLQTDAITDSAVVLGADNEVIQETSKDEPAPDTQKGPSEVALLSNTTPSSEAASSQGLVERDLRGPEIESAFTSGAMTPSTIASQRADDVYLYFVEIYWDSIKVISDGDAIAGKGEITFSFEINQCRAGELTGDCKNIVTNDCDLAEFKCDTWELRVDGEFGRGERIQLDQVYPTSSQGLPVLLMRPDEMIFIEFQAYEKDVAINDGCIVNKAYFVEDWQSEHHVEADLSDLCVYGPWFEVDFKMRKYNPDLIITAVDICDPCPTGPSYPDTYMCAEVRNQSASMSFPYQLAVYLGDTEEPVRRGGHGGPQPSGKSRYHCFSIPSQSPGTIPIKLSIEGGDTRPINNEFEFDATWGQASSVESFRETGIGGLTIPTDHVQPTSEGEVAASEVAPNVLESGGIQVGKKIGGDSNIAEIVSSRESIGIGNRTPISTPETPGGDSETDRRFMVRFDAVKVLDDQESDSIFGRQAGELRFRLSVNGDYELVPPFRPAGSSGSWIDDCFIVGKKVGKDEVEVTEWKVDRQGNLDMTTRVFGVDDCYVKAYTGDLVTLGDWFIASESDFDNEKLYITLAGVEWDFTDCKWETVQTANGPFPLYGLRCGPLVPSLQETMQPVSASHGGWDNWGIGEHVIRSGDFELHYTVSELLNNEDGVVVIANIEK